MKQQARDGLVALDLRAAQSPHYRERGIARFSFDLIAALLELDPALVGSVLVDPDLAPVPNLDRLLPSGRVRTPATWPSREQIFHAASPFDLDVPAGEIWLRRSSSSGMRLVLTVFDLIPHLFPDTYLTQPEQRANYRSRRHLVLAADHIVTLSQSAASDLTSHFGIPESKLTVIGAACDARFRPPASREDAAKLAAEQVAGLAPGYIVYNGGVEPRKNMDALVRAYAALPNEVTGRWQLVLVCRMDSAERERHRLAAHELGIAGRLILTGYIPDEQLVLLYQGADLVVYPSLYEGYGLPVTEAMACGAPVIASDTSSLSELLSPAGSFDPRDPGAISAHLHRALTEPSLREQLLEWSARPAPRWSEVAERAADVYRRCTSATSTPRAKRRPRLAVLAADDAGAARAQDLELIEALSRLAVVDVLQDGSPDSADWRLPGGSALVSPSTLVRADSLRGGYDAIVVTLRNDRSAATALQFLRRDRPAGAIVIAHDVKLVDLYALGAYTGAVPEGFVAAALAMYPWLSAEQVADHSPQAASERLGLLMAREVIGLSRRYLVDSRLSADLACTEAAPGDVGRISVLAGGERSRAERLLELIATAQADQLARRAYS